MEEQTIDFRKLTDKGIFGIFGSTGSGKSTIIDAMTIALYGKISRYDGSTNKDFINSSLDSMKVYFEFSIKEGYKNRYFAAERQYKKKPDGSLKQSSGRLYEKTEGEQINIIASKVSEITTESEKIIGLNYNDFIRSVILPQGRFSEFLMLENKDRRNMLERIFGLEEYGTKLSLKIKDKKNEQKDIVDKIKNKMSIYSDINILDIKNIEKEYKKGIEKYDNLKKEIEILNKEKNELDIFINYKNDYFKFNKQKEDLLLKEEYIKNKNEIIQKSEKAESVYKYIKEYEEIENKINENTKNLNITNKELEIIQNQLNEKSVNYENALIKKQNEYTDLIKKEENAEQAIKLSKETEKYKNENKTIKINLIKLKDNIENIKKEYNLSVTEKDNFNLKLKEILNKKNDIKIIPEYRQNIEDAVLIEKNYIQVKKKLEDEIQEKKDIKLNIEKQEKEYENIITNLNICKEEYNKINLELDNIKKNSPANSETIINEKEQINKKENYINELKTSFEKYKILKNDYEIKNKNIVKNNELLESICNEIDKCNIEIEKTELNLKIAQNNEMIVFLADLLKDNKECPVCGSLEHPKPAEKIAESLYIKIKNKSEELKSKFKELNDKKQKISIEIKTDNKFIENINLEMNNLNLDKSIDILKEEKLLQKEKENLNLLLDKIKKWELKKEEKEILFNKINEKINCYNIKYAELKNSLNKDKEILNNIDNKININNEEYLKLELKFNEYKNKYNLKSFNEEYEKIKKYELYKNKLESEEEKIRNEIDKKVKKLEIIKNQLDTIIFNFKEMKVKYIEKKEYIENQTEKINLLSENNKPDEYLILLKEKIKYIIENEEKTKNEFEKCQIIKQDTEKQKQMFLNENKILSQLKDEKDNELKLKMNEFQFLNRNEVINHIIKSELKLKIIEEVKDYYEKLNNIENNISILEKKLSEVDYNNIEDMLIQTKEKLNSLNIEFEECANNNAKLYSEINIMKENYDKIKLLNEQYLEHQHKLDLITDIYNVTYGNRFVEFISKRQLNYIAKEASERLKNMSKGRYAIVLNDVNFMIRDDFNGGILRVPRTLSGGETFLTSLSLALALSSKIQMKNNAPLEVFFLDEGFGTLDYELLDTVMNSLEQLHSEKINVGIITHVEELKNRIQSKLIVTSENNGITGTKVRIE